MVEDALLPSLGDAEGDAFALADFVMAEASSALLPCSLTSLCDGIVEFEDPGSCCFSSGASGTLSSNAGGETSPLRPGDSFSASLAPISSGPDTKSESVVTPPDRPKIGGGLESFLRGGTDSLRPSAAGELGCERPSWFVDPHESTDSDRPCLP